MNLHYIDDTLIFGQADIRQDKVIKLNLILVEILSGMRINFHKTVPVYMGHDPSIGYDFATIFNYYMGFFPITYLGVPLSPYAPRRQDWDNIILRIDRRLDE